MRLSFKNGKTQGEKEKRREEKRREEKKSEESQRERGVKSGERVNISDEEGKRGKEEKQ